MGGDATGLPEETVADVLSTLRLIPRWKLAHQDWDQVLSSLTRLHEAMARGARGAVYTALDEVDRFGPTRLGSISRSGATPGEASDRRGPPPPVMEILNSLVHPAGGWGVARPGETPPDPG